MRLKTRGARSAIGLLWLMPVASWACDASVPPARVPAKPAAAAVPCTPVASITIGDNKETGNIKVDDRYVYWVDKAGDLMSASRCDGVAFILFAGPLLDFFIDGNRILIRQGKTPAESMLMSVPRGGGAAVPFAGKMPAAWPVRFRDNYYWIDDTGVRVSQTFGGESTLLGPPGFAPDSVINGIVVDPLSVFWMFQGSEYSEGGIFRMSRRGGLSEQLVEGQGYLGGPQGAGGLFSDADNLYFIGWGQTIESVPKAGGPVRELTKWINPFDAGESNRYVYWTGWSGDPWPNPDFDGLRRVAKNGTSPEQRVLWPGAIKAFYPIGNGDEVWVWSNRELVRIPD